MSTGVVDPNHKSQRKPQQPLAQSSCCEVFVELSKGDSAGSGGQQGRIFRDPSLPPTSTNGEGVLCQRIELPRLSPIYGVPSWAAVLCFWAQ